VVGTKIAGTDDAGSSKPVHPIVGTVDETGQKAL